MKEYFTTLLKKPFAKIALICLAVILFIVLVYVLMNLSYFYKQLKFSLGRTDVGQTQTREKGEPNHLWIPSLGIDAPVVDPVSDREKDFQEALKSGVVHYPGTAGAGEVGNDYIFGHSSDFAFKGGSFKTVFALLPRIQNGAEVVVTNAAGDKFIYKVVDQFVANSNDVHLLEQDTGGKKILTLQTSYPIGTALKRYIVKTELVE